MAQNQEQISSLAGPEHRVEDEKKEENELNDRILEAAKTRKEKKMEDD